MRVRGIRLVLAVTGLTASMAASGGIARAGASCATAEHAGGEWRSYGHDLSNSRNQVDEHVLAPGNVAGVSSKWTFSVPVEEGNFQSMPIVADGCVYITTHFGFVHALNADTGEEVWGSRYAVPVEDVCCGGALFAPAVFDGVLYIHVSNNPSQPNGYGPHALAIDAATGELLWKSAPVSVDAGNYTNTSPVIFNGMDFFGISNPEGGITRGGFAILDIRTGNIIARTYTIPDDAIAAGYGGASLWSTAAVDMGAGYAYAGTGQPSVPEREHEHSNAILKIDVDPRRDTFGQIVDAYKGSPDVYVPNVDAQKPCQTTPSLATCLKNDVDFAASPTLLTNALGQELVVEFQKSGVVHAAFANTMQLAWTAIVAVSPGYIGNYTSTATDGDSVFVLGAYPGQMFSLDKDRGGYNWASPAVTTVAANPVAYANGVAYVADGKGFMDAYDAATGVPLLHRPMTVDTLDACTNIGGGVAIARNTIYAACGEGTMAGGWLVAYGL
jgi:outer membrane protein assembly factor BamB